MIEPVWAVLGGDIEMRTCGKKDIRKAKFIYKLNIIIQISLIFFLRCIRIISRQGEKT